MNPRISVTYIRELANYLAEQGVSAEHLLANTGVTAVQLGMADATVSRFACHRVLARAATLAPPGFALHLGRRMRPNHHGLLGHAMMCARTVGESLKILERFAITRGIPASFHLLPARSGQRLEFDLAMPVGSLRREYLEWALMIALAPVLEVDGGRPIRPDLVELDYPRPPHHELYRELIDCPLEFDRPRNAISFSAEALAMPQQSTNIEIREFCERRCELILDDLEANGDLADRVRNLLVSGPPPLPDAETTAATLHMSSRALRRGLRSEGTSFRVLVRQVREQLACRYLEQHGLTVDDVARLLGYAEPPAFSRAFKRWTGISPSRFRADKR